MLRLLLLCSLLSFAYCIEKEAETDTEVVQETLKLMLDFNKIPTDHPTRPMTPSSKQATQYMETLYRTFVAEDGSDDGNIVRNIEPSIGKVDDQEVMIFDISHIGKEQLMRGELHFHLRKRRSSRRRARALSARALCTNEYCTEAQYLHQIEGSPGSVVWDTTKALVETHALGGKQLIVRVSGPRTNEMSSTRINLRNNVMPWDFVLEGNMCSKISRKDVRMRSYSEMVRKSSPFLLVFSRAENTLDGERVRREVEGARRRRRETEGYYSYNAEESSTPAGRFRQETLLNDRNGFDLLKPRSKGAKLRAHRRKAKNHDIWHGFGESADSESDEEDSTEVPKKHFSNDVRVVLLGEDKATKVCQRHSMMVDFVELGWHNFVLAPAFFEAGHCAGTCRYPLSKTANPSNHAVLQSLLMPFAPPVCCSPDRMESLTVLYKDEYGRTTIKNFPRMIVQSCGCI